jgi:hypothetical protein
VQIIVANSFRTGSVDSIDRNIGMIIKNLRKRGKKGDKGVQGSRFSSSTVQSSGLRVRGSGFRVYK